MAFIPFSWSNSCGQLKNTADPSSREPSSFLSNPLVAIKGWAVLCRMPTLEFNIMADDPVTRHFFHGFIRLHILYHAAKEPIYGAEITEELVRHGYRLSQGTLYPTLHLLEKLGYLKNRTEIVNGKRRKYYHATNAGRRILVDARNKLLELVREIVEDKDGGFLAIQMKHRPPQTSTSKRNRRAKNA
jgi:PadR family transcriptional regulator PadR